MSHVFTANFPAAGPIEPTSYLLVTFPTNLPAAGPIKPIILHANLATSLHAAFPTIIYQQQEQ